LKKVLLVYETQTGNTEALAKIIDSRLKTAGFDVVFKRISKANEDRFDLIRVLGGVDAVIIGSPTHYSRIMTPVQDFLTDMGRANMGGKVDLSKILGAAFGSYGWSGSGEGVGFITNTLKNTLKMKVVEPGLLIKGSPGGTTLEEGQTFCQAVIEKLNQV
jgi:flavorubredoxin